MDIVDHAQKSGESGQGVTIPLSPADGSLLAATLLPRSLCTEIKLDGRFR